jgi:hypothetical protein
MKKTILFSSGVAISFFLLSSFNVGTTKQTEKRCIKIKCGKKAHFELFTGHDEADIARQIKYKYETCTWSNSTMKNCKTGKESKF